MNQLDGYDIEDLEPGMSASFTKTITEGDALVMPTSRETKPA